MCSECRKHQDVRGFGGRCLLCQWMQSPPSTAHILRIFSCRLRRCFDSLTHRTRVLWSHQFAELFSPVTGRFATSVPDSVCPPSSGSEGQPERRGRTGDDRSDSSRVALIGVNSWDEGSSVALCRNAQPRLVDSRSVHEVQSYEGPYVRNIQVQIRTLRHRANRQSINQPT